MPERQNQVQRSVSQSLTLSLSLSLSLSLPIPFSHFLCHSLGICLSTCFFLQVCFSYCCPLLSFSVNYFDVPLFVLSLSSFSKLSVPLLTPLHPKNRLGSSIGGQDSSNAGTGKSCALPMGMPNHIPVLGYKPCSRFLGSGMIGVIQHWGWSPKEGSWRISTLQYCTKIDKIARVCNSKRSSNPEIQPLDKEFRVQDIVGGNRQH